MTTIPGNIVRTLRPERPDGKTRRLNTWQAVRADVLERIRSRKWPPGELIPTEQNLAAEMGCARATVNRALRDLAQSGIIERRRKVGTRVTSTQSRRTTLQMPLIRDEIEALDATYAYRLISCALTMPTPLAAEKLMVDPARELLLIRAQYMADGAPHCCEALWINPRFVPDLTAEQINTVSAGEWLADNLSLTHERYSILAEGASGECAKYLHIVENTAVLTIERLNWRDEDPVVFARQFYPPHHRLVAAD